MNWTQEFETKVIDALTLFAMSLANPKKLDGHLTRAWCIALSGAGLTGRDVEHGAGQLLQTAKFFPSPSELIEAVHGDLENRIELAWQQVRRMTQRIGTACSWFASDLGGDRVALWAAEQVGLDVLGDMTDETRPFRRQEFGRLYRAGIHGGAGIDRIVGTFELQNRATGRELSPALIGRPDLSELPAACEPSELNELNGTKSGRMQPLGELAG